VVFPVVGAVFHAPHKIHSGSTDLPFRSHNTLSPPTKRCYDLYAFRGRSSPDRNWCSHHSYNLCSSNLYKKGKVHLCPNFSVQNFVGPFLGNMSSRSFMQLGIFIDYGLQIVSFVNSEHSLKTGLSCM
jgi:hypothetical protein